MAETLCGVVPENAHALRLFRILPNGEPRTYSATTFPTNPYQGCERMIRMARAVGWIGGNPEDSYGLIEAIDDEWSILGDWPIPDANSFAALKKKLGIVVVPTPDEASCA